MSCFTFRRLPDRFLEGSRVFVVDPMLATGILILLMGEDPCIVIFYISAEALGHLCFCHGMKKQWSSIFSQIWYWDMICLVLLSNFNGYSCCKSMLSLCCFDSKILHFCDLILDWSYLEKLLDYITFLDIELQVAQ